MKLFKKSYLYLAFASMSLLVFCFNASADGNDGGENGDEQKIIDKVRRTLSYMHYAPKSLDNNFSEKVYNNYLDALDPYKRIFKQEDIVEFSKSKDLMDDYFKDNNVDFYHTSIDRLYQRLDESEKYINSILSKPINLEEADYYLLDEEKKSFPKNLQEWEKGWQQYVKYSILNEVYSTIETNENKKDSLKIKIPTLSKQQLIDSAVVKVKENITESFRRMKARKKSDFFGDYVNAFAEVYDPHTTYFSPKDTQDFSETISGKFEGIGAAIQDKKGYPTISTLIIGGPAWKSKQLDPGDVILKVAQGDKEPVNVVGMFLDDAIRLIKGKKGTKVILTIKKKDGTIKEVSIIRDEVEIEDSYAKSTVIIDDKGDKYGLISFPSFYLPFDSKGGRYVSEDIEKEIIKLKKENIKGLILDIRSNGGGSLSEVVNIVGLFIKSGPVVQVVSSDGTRKTYSDEDEKIVWDGPLTVMVNEFSASASEILAGAIQDYQRGVVIGSPQTYGKGTVQQVFPLDRFSFGNSNSGDLKLTVQKYYRITGNSVQLHGVSSDIILPDRYTYSDIKESTQKNAMPWDKIDGTIYSPWQNNFNLDYLRAKSFDRNKNSDYLKKVEAASKWLETIYKEEKISLQYDEFMAEMKQRKDLAKKYEFKDYKNTLEFSWTASDKNLIASDTIQKAKKEDWVKNLKKDYYINETVKVLHDMIN